MPPNPRRVLPGVDGAAQRRLEDYVRRLERRLDDAGGASTSDDVTNESGVAGANVTDALDQLEADMATLVPTSRTITAGAGLTGGGDLSANRTIAANVGTTAGTLAAGDDSRFPSLSVWMPDAPATSPNSRDSEGTSTSGWTVWDPAGSSITHTVASSCHVITQTSQTGDKFGGVYKTIPTSNEWVMYVKLGLRVGMQRFFQGGIAMWDTNAASSPTTAKFAGGALVQGNGTDGNYSQQWIWTNYTTVSSLVRNTNPIGFRSGGYLRMRVNMTGGVGSTPVFDVDFSCNGIDWVIHSVSGATGVGFTPVYCGMIVDNAGTGNNSIACLYDFVRFQEGTGTSGFTATSLGNLVKVGV